MMLALAARALGRRATATALRPAGSRALSAVGAPEAAAADSEAARTDPFSSLCSVTVADTLARKVSAPPPSAHAALCSP
eukprot:PRCOL_00000401-RA